MLLKDKVCVIAGAGSLRSIGYATAELFAEHGGKIVVVDVMMDDTLLRNIQSSIQSQVGDSISVQGVRCDVSKLEDC